MTGRCGSSTIAGIFHAHGVWCGTRKAPSIHNPHGYFENIPLKMALRNRFKFDFLGDEPEPQEGWIHEVERIIKADGYTDGPWMYKHGAFFHKVWKDFDPFIVKIQRNLPDVVKSYDQCGFLKSYSRHELESIIRRQKIIMDKLPGVTINAEPYFDKDYTELKAAIEYCGLNYDQQITEGFLHG